MSWSKTFEGDFDAILKAASDAFTAAEHEAEKRAHAVIGDIVMEAKKLFDAAKLEGAKLLFKVETWGGFGMSGSGSVSVKVTADVKQPESQPAEMVVPETPPNP